MSDRIAAAVNAAIEHLQSDPQSGACTDSAARAALTEGLRTEVKGPNGQHIVSDMPPGVGGLSSAPSPGWYFRAAVASCTATIIAIRAAAVGIALSRLEVEVVSQSDDRGMLGVDDTVPPGPINFRMDIVIAASGADPIALRDLAEWGVVHSPVADAFRRAVPMDVAIVVN
ncbi:MAG TPA: OsmC family protein [Aestuariivirgaceae bacterium]|nr:OsmC family protein [Aestuariivirgaceae bacterium]